MFHEERGTNAKGSNHTHYIDSRGIYIVNSIKSPHLSLPNNFQSDSITLVSQMSIDDTKMQRLIDLASRWSGYISMALYFWPKAPSEASCTASVEKANSVVNRIFANFTDLLQNTTFHLVINAGRDDLPYPNNFLRNVAMRNVMTDYMLYLDADIIPPSGSHDSLLKRFKTTPELLNNEHALLVLPAFERKILENESAALLTSFDLPDTKDALLEQLEKNPSMFEPFYSCCPELQGPSNYSYWYQAHEIYPVVYQNLYEPYYVVRMIDTVPPFWEHFYGFGLNKVSWVEEVATAGFRFYVSPDMFIIHINHERGNQGETPYIRDEYEHQFKPYLERRYGK